MAACCYVSAPPFRSSRTGLKRARSDESDSEDDEYLSVDWYSCSYRCVPQSEGGCEGRLRGNKVQKILNPYLAAFFNLFDNDDVIRDFLWVDSCAKLSDKYLLAMVYVYFRRASLTVEEYTRMNFFTALYLANDMEEDEEEEKYELFPWALGESWMTVFPSFLVARDQLWDRMGFRAIVSRRTCEEVIGMVPSHEIWQRTRLSHHGGAIRAYMKPSSPQYGRSSPTFCEHCSKLQREREGGRGREDSRDEDCPSLPTMDLLDEIDCSFGSLLPECEADSFLQSHTGHSSKRFPLFGDVHEE